MPAAEPSRSEPIIQLQNVSYGFFMPDGTRRDVLKNVSLEIFPGSITCLMGTSGSGKTTLLRLVAGLIQPDEGEVRVFGQPISGRSERDLTEIRREIGFVFQYSALFDSMNVGQNIGFALERRRRPRKEIDAVVTELLNDIGLPGIENKRPSELSGGQKKRVAMARALAANPKIVLYDEPDSGLDPVMTRTIDGLIAEMRDLKQTTNVVVTHNVTSAWRIADRILMLSNAQIVADGPPRQVEKLDVPMVREFLADFSAHDQPKLPNPDAATANVSAHSKLPA